MALDWLRNRELEVFPAAVKILKAKLPIPCVVFGFVLGIRNMPQSSPNDGAMLRQMSWQSGDILQHDGGISKAGREDVWRKRVGAVEEGGPCRPAVAKDAINRCRGWY